MTFDPLYVSQVCRGLRRLRGWTQENLAEAAHLSTRTIEKVESGKHSAHEETLDRIARALGVNVSAFQTPTEADIAGVRMSLQKADKLAMVRLTPISSPHVILDTLGSCHALDDDVSRVVDAGALKMAAALLDDLHDLMDIGDDMTMSDRVDTALSMVEQCAAVGELGYRCSIGTYRQVLPADKSHAALLFRVVLLSMCPTEQWQELVLVRIGGGWLSHPDDRPPPEVLMKAPA